MVANLGVYDYDKEKICDLYDSQNSILGQAYEIRLTKNYNGLHTLSFKIPYMVDEKQNFRWNYMRSDFLIRLYYDGNIEWFVANKPRKSKNQSLIVGEVDCNSMAMLLKTKNIYTEFDDENGIGTIQELMPKVLAGSGWTLGYCQPILESDGMTEKVRSLKSDNKKGVISLINTLCNLFRCRPVYNTTTQTVDIYDASYRDQSFEGEIGRNLKSLSVEYNSDDVVTRLYVEGEYGDYGYIGIDDVNPTGLTYIFNFDYYRETGLFKQRHEEALSTYLEDIADIVSRIRSNAGLINQQNDALNDKVGQCKIALFYVSHGFANPIYTYGELTNAQKTLTPGDEVVILNQDGTYRTEIMGAHAEDLISTGDYGIAKFATSAYGSIGTKEVQIEAKEKQITNLQRKIATTTKEDRIAEYTREIETLEQEISNLYVMENTGLYAEMDLVMNPIGLLAVLWSYLDINELLKIEQNEVEATFVSAMGNMLRDGYWQNSNYAIGQEEHLYADSVEMLEELSRPSVTYTIDYIRSQGGFDIPIEDIHINAIARIHDDDLNVHENLYVEKIMIGIDNPDYGVLNVSNNDINIGNADLGLLLSRMSQLADLIDQKNRMYERAKAFSSNGTLYADRLNGQIDVLKNQLLSTVSNWYTDDQGNIMFEAADGGSAMMLCGAGFMISNSKDDSGNWVWRTFGTGEGFTADEIVAGFISAERIEAGSIATSKLTPDAGNTLIISGNPAIVNLNKQLAPSFDEETTYLLGEMVMYNGQFYVFTQNHPAGAWNENHVVSSDLSTQIELLPDKIIEYVGQQGYGRTYIQLTDPALDPDKNVLAGDYWIRNNLSGSSWSDVKTKTWNQINSFTWGQIMLGSVEMYCRNGNGEWIKVHDTAQISEAYTRITQTQFEIRQEAYRANAAEGELRSTIVQTADSITQEVERVRNSTIARTEEYQTVESIIQDAQEMADAAAVDAKNASIAKTSTYQSAESIVSVAVANVTSDNASAEVFSTSKSYAVGDRVIYAGKLYRFKTAHPAGAWDSSHVDRIYAGDSKYIAQTSSYQTASSIVTEAVRQSGVNASTTYLAKTQDYQTVNSIIQEAQNKADAAAVDAKNASIAKTSTYQSAESIVSVAVANVTSDNAGAEVFSTTKAYAVGDRVIYGGRLYRFKTAHSAGAWNSSHVDRIYAGDSKYIAQTTTYQTASSIVTEAVSQAATSANNTYLAKTNAYKTVGSIIQAAQDMADAAAVDAKNASIAKTSTYQSAESIVSVAIANVTSDNASAAVFSTTKAYAVGDRVMYNGKLYKFKAAHSAGAWNSSHVDRIYAGDSAYIAQTTTYQTASSIVSAAKTYTNGQLENYSTTEQTATQISTYVTNNAYKIQSGITINSSGVSITGSKYVKIQSGGSFKVQSDNMEIDSTTGKIATCFGVSGKSQDGAVDYRSNWETSNTGIIFTRELGNNGTWSPNSKIKMGYELYTGSGSNLTLIDNDISQIMFDSAVYAVREPQLESTEARYFTFYFSKQHGTGTTSFIARRLLITETSGRYNYNSSTDEITYIGSGTRSGLGSVIVMRPYARNQPFQIGTSALPVFRVYAEEYYGKEGYVNTFSSREYKRDITSLEDMGYLIDQLRPVSFRYKKGKGNRLFYGLIYEETVNILPVICKDDGMSKTIGYDGLIPILLKEVQQLRKRVKELEESTK